MFELKIHQTHVTFFCNVSPNYARLLSSFRELRNQASCAGSCAARVGELLDFLDDNNRFPAFIK